MTEQFIEAYRRHKNLKLAANELGVRWQTLYVWLRKAGEPVTGDKARYGCESDRFAAKAERLFKQLVPDACDENAFKFQAKVDFTVGPYKVDLKAARFLPSNKASKCGRWNFSIKKQEVIADFFVCLGYDREGEAVVKCFLIPAELAKHYQTVNVSSKRGKWAQYEIGVEELAPFFSAMTEEAA